jgi:uncharacterized membrane protein YiaA
MTHDDAQNILLVLGFLWLAMGLWNAGRRQFAAMVFFMAGAVCAFVVAVIVGSMG